MVRLVGLYHALRGAHTFFLRAGSVERWGGYIINLIHYEDAASLCLAVRARRCVVSERPPVTQDLSMGLVT